MSKSRGRNRTSRAGMVVMAGVEQPVLFKCGDAQLMGIASIPAQAFHRGVVIVVGGPQYRTGSHRQFTLLCRQLAADGIASLRFDYHGMGDSEGPPALGVDGIAADIRCAIDAFLARASGVTEIVLWGLCGAASASALYAPGDARVTGLVMLNPWVRTEQGHAKTQLQHYYLARLLNREFWLRMVSGNVNLWSSMRGLAQSAKSAIGGASSPALSTSSAATEGAAPKPNGSLPDRMLAALVQAQLPALVILSGDQDMTANEFRQLVGESRSWARWMALPHTQCMEVAGSSHTFASADWRGQVAAATSAWVKASLPAR